MKQTMKKTLLTVACLAATLAAGATDYQGNLTVKSDGTVETLATRMGVADNGDGTATVTVYGMECKCGGQTVSVGDVVLNNVATSSVGNITLMETRQTVSINGSNVPVAFRAEKRGEDKLNAAFVMADLAAPGNTVCCTFGERHVIGQILGSDFEAWHTAEYTGGFPSKTYTSDEPDGWHSFMSATGSLSSTVRKNTYTFISDETRPGSAGTKSLKVVSGKVMTVPANGTVTTGRLHAGSISAANTGNNATSDPAAGDVDTAGDPFFAPLASRPDAVTLWVKYKQGPLASGKEDYKYATVSAVIHDNSKYQDPEDTEYANVVAKAQDRSIESQDFTWQQVTVPFDYESYKDNGASPRTILVTISTNAQPGVASTDTDNPDVLFVDDLSLVYDATLASVSIAGNDVEGFDGSVLAYDGITLDHELTLEEVSCAATSPNATVYTSISREETGKAVVYVTVVGDDMQTVNTYSFAVNEPLPVKKTEYTDQLLLTLNGEPQDPQTITIEVTDHEDGTYDFMLKEFSFMGVVLIGDVTMTNVPGEEVNGYIVYETEQDADITNGAEIAEALGGKVHITMAAQSKDDALYALISLPVVMGEDVINVDAVFGTQPETAITAPAHNTGVARKCYDLSGRQLKAPVKGVNIIRLEDGRTVKVMVK